ncbi:uncharacterized protein LOC135196478 [Macrobrachium nipponense]|uniref:uncharacterized protein LOC135196478 n=1 Tax=Macrobrachium nipponense TaxID=159736 RepID=UPI0030C8760C
MNYSPSVSGRSQIANPTDSASEIADLKATLQRMQVKMAALEGSPSLKRGWKDTNLSRSLKRNWKEPALDSSPERFSEEEAPSIIKRARKDVSTPFAAREPQAPSRSPSPPYEEEREASTKKIQLNLQEQLASLVGVLSKEPPRRKDNKLPIKRDNECILQIIIGRSPSCDLHFASPHISRQHCEITRLRPHGTLIIKNLRPTNVTYVETYELREPSDFIELTCGSLIGLGVPLGESRTNENFVFLRLCQDQRVTTTSSNRSQEQNNTSNITASVPQCPQQNDSSQSLQNVNKSDEVLSVPSPPSTTQEGSSSLINQHRKARRRSYQTEISSPACIPENSSGSKNDAVDIPMLENASAHQNSNTLLRQNALDHRALSSPGQSGMASFDKTNSFCLDKTNSFSSNKDENAKPAENRLSGVKERRHSSDVRPATSIFETGPKASVQRRISVESKREGPDQMQRMNSQTKQSGFQEKPLNIGLPYEHTKLVNQDALKSVSQEHPSNSKLVTAMEHRENGGIAGVSRLDDLTILQTNTVKDSRGSFGFTPSLYSINDGSPKLQKDVCEKPRMSKLSLSNRHQVENIYCSHEDIEENKPSLINQKSRQPVDDSADSLLVCKTSLFPETMEKSNSLSNFGNAVSPCSIDLTQPDPDERFKSSVDENPDQVCILEEEVCVDLTLGSKEKANIKRKRNLDNDENEEKEDGKRRRSSCEKKSDKDKESELDICLPVLDKDCRSAVVNKQVKGKLPSQQLQGNERPVSNSGAVQNLKPDQGKGNKGRSSTVSVREKRSTLENEVEQKNNSDKVHKMQKSSSLVVSDSDDESQVMPVIQAGKRKHRFIISSDSESDSGCEEERTSGLKLIEENLVGKKCVIPLPRILPDIVRAIRKGKAILDEKDELKVVSSETEFESKSESDADICFLDEEDDELPDLSSPKTSRLSGQSKTKSYESKEKKKGCHLQEKKGIKPREKSSEENSKFLDISDKGSHKYRDKRKGKDSEKTSNYDGSSCKKSKSDGKDKGITSVSTAKGPVTSVGNSKENDKCKVRLLNCSSSGSGKDAHHQDSANEKLEDDISLRIKKEKVEEVTSVVVKREPEDNDSSNKTVVGDDDDDDCDDVIFMYSQIDETIWVSSDEEDTPSQENGTFGPLPPSPDFGIASLFDEAGCDSGGEVTKKAEPNLSSAVHVDEDDDEDDQWFPVLSQSFWDDDDLIKPSGKEMPKETKSQEIIPKPGPSGINVTPSSDTHISSWWPELSQGFDDEEEEEFNSDTSASVEDSKARSTGKSLDSVIEKFKNRGARKAQLIEPKAPLPRTSNDSLRKRSRSSSGSNADKVKANLVRPSPKEKQHTTARKETSESCSKSSSRKRKKGPSLRDNLSNKFNLDSYRALARQQSKEKESPHEKTRDSRTKVTEQTKKSHLISDKPRSDENISIQKKTSHQESKEQSRPKVAVKITRKTRAEKLTEVNLFPSPQLPPSRSKRSTFTIPKKKATPVSEAGKPSESPVEKSSNTPKDSKLSKSLDLKEGSRSPLCSPVAQLTSSHSQNVSSFTRSEVRERTRNSESEIVRSSDEKNDNSGCSAPVQTEAIVMGSEEDKENEAGGKTVKSILKIFGSKKSLKKNVHFPVSSGELNKIKYISPRKNSEKLGHLEPRMKEVLPRELIFSKHNIPLDFPDHFIVNVCMWNYDWLETYRRVQEKIEVSGRNCTIKPPPVVKSISYPTLILYESFLDYKEIFSDLFYLEVWENIFRDWQKYRQNNISMPVYIDKVEEVFTQRKHESPMKSWNIKVITLLTQDQSNRGRHPAQGSLISLKVSRDSERKKSQHVFGYVQDLLKQKRRMMPKELENVLPHAEAALVLDIRIAKEPGPELRCGNVLSLCNISYIRPFTRTWEGLCKLPLSPLCNDILSPKEDSFMPNHSAKYLVPEMPLNESQVQAVVKVSAKCVYDPHLPKLSLIHGPPGTGKTRTIVSLVAQIVRLSEEACMSNCRILLCAPSNAVADELTLRLVKLREINIALRVVRVGIRDSITPEVRGYSLDAFITKHMNRELKTPKNVSARKEWERKKNMVNVAGKDLAKAKKENKPREAIRAMEKRRDDLMKSLSEMEKSFAVNLTPKEHQMLYKKCQRDYLLGAQVITTTLGGCFSGPMAEVFTGVDHPFTSCIVDEAGQCKETEMWVPLLYSMRKLVLVGDHRQLPATVLSKLAQDKNLKQSLFERLYHRFVVELQKDELVHTLDTQFRMHPEIVHWPSEHFYFNKLKTSPDVIQERSYDCLPYAVFDVKNSLERRGPRNELFNPTECHVVRLILDSIEPHVSKLKIGVITPYQSQKFHLEKELNGFCNRLNININTIDGFQGQERDVIILSFVRANPASQIGFLSEPQRLNVALTRGRKSCFVVASLSSLSQNKDWQSLISNARARNLVYEIQDGHMNEGYFKSVLVK